MIITRTPFRVSFFGGGTDYPGWYLEHGGAVLSTTIDKFCYLTCRYLPPFFDTKYRIVWSKLENVREIERRVALSASTPNAKPQDASGQVEAEPNVGVQVIVRKPLPGVALVRSSGHTSIFQVSDKLPLAGRRVESIDLQPVD